ncbi:MAG: hypothetical protein R2698_13920 [Microthrixaceae bacterium]
MIGPALRARDTTAPGRPAFARAVGRGLLGWMLVAVSLASLTSVSTAAFSDSTDTAGGVAAGALTGPNAPNQGVASFSATGSTGNCSLSWSALSGGTAVADRFEVLGEPSGSTVTTTPAGTVGAGGYSAPVSDAVNSYRLRTRTANNWVAPSAETSTTTCVRTGMVSVATGDYATCGITTALALWCWGEGIDYKSGENSQWTRSQPNLENGAATWRQVSAGDQHVCAIRTDGSLWCLGGNWTGQLGVGDTNPRANPTRVGTGSDWEMVDAAVEGTCGIRSGGTLWCWGRGDLGTVGDGTASLQLTPVAVGTSKSWRQVSGGQYQVCAIATDSTMWCWGANWYGEVGDGTSTQRNAPVQIGLGTSWASVSAGYSHTCAITAAGEMWCWGSDDFGEGGAATGTALTPKQVPGSGWAQVVTGRDVTCATRIDRSLWCFGTNADGRTARGLASGTTTTPTRIGTATDWAVLSLTARHGCAVRTDQTMWCWGAAGVGATGQGNLTWRSTATVGSDTDWSSAALGGRHSCAIKTAQSLWCWGWNDNGQLGLGHAQDGTVAPANVAPGTTWLRVARNLPHLWDPDRPDHVVLGRRLVRPDR